VTNEKDEVGEKTLQKPGIDTESSTLNREGPASEPITAPFCYHCSHWSVMTLECYDTLAVTFPSSKPILTKLPPRYDPRASLVGRSLEEETSIRVATSWDTELLPPNRRLLIYRVILLEL